MNIAFVHDHLFRRVDGVYYSTGGLSNEVLTRYTSYCDNLVVIARIKDEDSVNGRWSRIDNTKVQICGNKNLLYKGLKNKVKAVDRVIIRLPSILGLRAVWYARKYSKKYFVEVVGCAWDALWNRNITGKILAPFIFLANRAAISRSPYVLYVTQKFLQSRYPSSGKTIGCSDVDIRDLNEDIQRNRLNRIKKSKGKLVLGTIGAVDVRYKNQKSIINALGILNKEGYKNIEYQLVGNGDKSFLEGIVRKNELIDKVVFKGGIPHEDIYDWLDSIDVYIQPSKQEGLPRSVVEAMSRGVPVLTSNRGGMPELVDAEFQFDPDNVNGIVQLIRDITIDKLINMSVFCYRKAADYQKEILEKRRNEFYREFLND